MRVAADMPAKASSAPGGAISRGGAAALARPVAQPGGERHEIEDVIGVQVRDHDRVDRGVVHVPAQLGEHPRPAVEQHDLAATLDEVAGAGAVGVLPGGGLPENGDAHWLADPIARRGARAAPRRARR